MPRALILGPQRRSIVSSNPITTGAAAGRKVAISINRSRLAAARDDHAARLRIRWKVQNLGSRSSPRMRSAAASTSTGRQNEPSEQYQDVRPGRPREQIGKTYEAREKARRQRIVGAMQAMGVFHPTRRNRRTESRQPGRAASNRIGDHISTRRRSETSGTLQRMTKPDATLALIAARFTRHDVEK